MNRHVKLERAHALSMSPSTYLLEYLKYLHLYLCLYLHHTYTNVYTYVYLHRSISVSIKLSTPRSAGKFDPESSPDLQTSNRYISGFALCSLINPCILPHSTICKQRVWLFFWSRQLATSETEPHTLCIVPQGWPVHKVGPYISS